MVVSGLAVCKLRLQKWREDKMKERNWIERQKLGGLDCTIKYRVITEIHSQ